MQYRCRYLSEEQIEKIASAIRKILGLSVYDALNVMNFLESDLQRFGGDFGVVSNYKLSDAYARTYPGTKKIVIQENIYDHACDGHIPCLLIIAHEFGHFFLHREEFSLPCPVSSEIYIPNEENPEWQADQFKCHFLVPIHRGLLKMSTSEICSIYKVSDDIAREQLLKCKKRFMPPRKPWRYPN